AAIHVLAVLGEDAGGRWLLRSARGTARCCRHRGRHDGQSTAGRSTPMTSNPELSLVLADPRRLADLRVEQIPALLGALEALRAGLWARMLRTPEVSVPSAAGAAEEM